MEMTLDLHDDYVVFAKEVAKDVGVDVRTVTEWLLGYIGETEDVDPWVKKLKPIRELQLAEHKEG